MWKMLCSGTRAKGAASGSSATATCKADARTGSAHWDAHYRFSATGRIVDNSIDSHFTFTPDGLIATQRDRFDFCAGRGRRSARRVCCSAGRRC